MPANPTAHRRWALTGLIMMSLVAGGCSRSPGPIEGTASLAALAREYNIRVVTRDVQPADNQIRAKACRADELDRYESLFAEEFGLYPPDVIRRVQLASVVFCKDLAYDGQLRGAIPDFESNTLYLDAVRGARSPSYLRKVIHHDFFHMIDYRDDGNLYIDKEWESLNPAGFHYGTGGANAQNDSLSSVLTDRYPGFLNSYSRTGVEEDKAEIFANLIVEPASVERRCQSDAVLRSKVAALKRLLVRFSPDADERFWARTAASR
jgi:hypothetical protein